MSPIVEKQDGSYAEEQTAQNGGEVFQIIAVEKPCNHQPNADGKQEMQRAPRH